MLRQLLDPDELALEREKARGNYTPRQLLDPDELALERAKYAARSPRKRDAARKREREKKNQYTVILAKRVVSSCLFSL